ncbi:MAG TPA: DUF3820 family protein [Verrucomicrobiae bacterium]|jgi:hypothetical protein|nr:DUF3820 family protein [Verrucomicrobiae bacterium]
MSKPSFNRSGQRMLLTKSDFVPGSYRRRPSNLQRELTDNDPFPFGVHKGKPMWEVPTKYLRWFLEQDWSVKWPFVRKFALKSFAPPPAPEPPPPVVAPKSDPAAAQRALDELVKVKNSLCGNN